MPLRVIQELTQIRNATSAAESRIAAEGFDPSAWPECMEQASAPAAAIVVADGGSLGGKGEEWGGKSRTTSHQLKKPLLEGHSGGSQV